MNGNITGQTAQGMLALMDLMPTRFADELFDGEPLDFAADGVSGFDAAEADATAARPARMVWFPGVLAICGSAVCVAVLIGVMLALRNAAPETLQSGAETTTQTTQTTASAETATTGTADTHTDPPQTADSAVVTQSTGTVIPETRWTELRTTEPETTAPPESIPQTVTTTATTAADIPQRTGADPEAVIRELKAGRQTVFRCSGSGAGYLAGWQNYGVAFLCDDPESLRGTQIGGHPVALTEGTWSQYGGTRAVDGENGCTVQRVSDFLHVYGDSAPLSGIRPQYPETGSTAELERVLAQYEKDGQTLCMVSLGSANLKFTQESGGTAFDHSEIIRAIAADSALTLVGLVWCEEGTAAELPFGEIRILVQFEANCTPDPADYAEYGELEYFVGHWEIVTALENPPADGDRTKIWQALANMCAKLEARPEIRTALPELNYPM